VTEPICIPCRRQNHKYCTGSCSCQHTSPVVGLESSKKHGTNRKSDYELVDPQSTGRKRAAKQYPLDPDAECEFANRANAGAIPRLKGIDGCGKRSGSTVGRQQARHHLDYNTLNNEPDNVVRICHSCHVIIHHLNDPLKDEYYRATYGEAAARGLERTYRKLKPRKEEE